MAARATRKAISVLIIEDSRLFRLGLSALLKKQEGLKLLAASGKARLATRPKSVRQPDVVLLDLGLGDVGIVQVVRSLRATHPEAGLIVMGLVPEKSEVLGLLKEGVSGLILKDASIGDFVSTIRAVAAGQHVFPAALTDSLLSQIVDDAARKGMVELADVKMTAREREIVDLLADGLSNKAIANKLHIAIDTVKSHVHNILEKLSVRSRMDVAVRSRGRTPPAR
jgi:DNA-binding NarL/FixJ family response regulator